MKKKDTALLVGGTLTGMCVVLNVLALECIRKNFVRKSPKVYPGKIESVDEMHMDYLRRKNIAFIKNRRIENLEIKSRDGLVLFGQYIYSNSSQNENEPTNIVILSHGYGGNGYKDMVIFTEFYSKMGYDVLLIDQRAHGKSEGTAITFGAHESDDIILWARTMVEKHAGNCKMLIHGWSMGAAGAYLAAAKGLPTQVKGIVYDCGYSVAEAQFMHFAKRTIPLPNTLIWYVLQFMKPWCKILCDFNMKDSSPLFVSRSMRLPIFFVHGAEDSCVPMWMGRRLYEATDRTAYRDMLIVPETEHTYCYIHAKDAYEDGILKLIEKCMN